MELPEWFTNYVWPWIVVAAAIVQGVIYMIWGRQFLALKDERLKSKDEVIQGQEHRIEALKDQLVFYQAMTPAALLESVQASSKLQADLLSEQKKQLEKAENERNKAVSKLEEIKENYEQIDDTKLSKDEQVARTQQLVSTLDAEVEKQSIAYEAVRGLVEKPTVRFKDAYGPIGSWYRLFMYRTAEDMRFEKIAEREGTMSSGKFEQDSTKLANLLKVLNDFESKGPIFKRTEEAMKKLAESHKDDPETYRQKMNELEAEAWEEFIELTFSQAIQWAGTKKEDDD